MNSARNLVLSLFFALFIATLVATPSTAQCPNGGWTISGTVVDDLGVGLVGFDLDVLDPNGTPLTLSQDFTVAGGVFSLVICDTAVPSLISGFYTFIVNPPAAEPFFLGTFPDQFLVGNGGTLAAPLVLERGHFVTGVVRDQLGVSLEQADLQFYDSVSGALIQFSGESTDASGEFSVLVTPGTYDIVVRELPLITSPPGPYVPAGFLERVVNGNTNLGIVTLYDAITLTGTVTNDLGQLLNGADIDVSDPRTGTELLLSGDITGLIAPAGQFSVEVPAGTWEVEIEPPPGSNLAAALVTVVVTAPGPATIGTVQLEQGVAVSGTTRNPSSAPVPSVDLDFIITATGVEIATADDNANAFGNFSVIVVPDTYDIQFKPLFSTGLAPVQLDAQDISVATNLGSVTLPLGNALTGNVTLNGVPVEGAIVTLASGGQPAVVFGNRSDPLGNYALRQVPGSYDVTVSPPIGGGGAAVNLTGVDLSTDQVVDVDLGAPAAPPPVLGLSCTDGPTEATLDWALGAPDYDSITVDRDGTMVATLPGSATSIIDGPLPAAVYVYQVRSVRGGLESSPVSCVVTVGAPPQVTFVRGDRNGDTAVNIADAIGILAGLFTPGEPPSTCPDAEDANDDGQVNIADAIFLLGYLFSSGPAPLTPFPATGVDPTADSLGCA